MCSLLSDNDLSAIQTAIDARLHITLERSYAGRRLRATTSRAPKAWWPHLWLVRIERWDGHIYSSQYLTSAEEIVTYGQR